MIKKLRKQDLDQVMKIWLDSNTEAHDFIPSTYWLEHFKMVKEMIAQSEVYTYQKENSNEIQGFVGLSENYIAGIFVSSSNQSKGIGRMLLEYIKSIKEELTLSVYEKNQRAVKFYKRENFKIQSKEIDDHTGEEELYMVWKK